MTTEITEANNFKAEKKNERVPTSKEKVDETRLKLRLCKAGKDDITPEMLQGTSKGSGKNRTDQVVKYVPKTIEDRYFPTNV